MLTTAAFNALLKTLEEPPAHVIFIFATTEPHKIPATILSRCQRFDYRRVTLAQIQQRLTEVTQAEGITAEPAALALIARAAEGSMRDSLSLLDQVIAFSGSQITVSSVRDSIGLVEGQTLLGILEGIFKQKPLDALALIDQAYSRGHDLRVLTRSLIEFLHAAILAKIGAQNSGTLELSTEEWNELVSIASHRDLEEIEMIFQVMHHGLDWIARSPQPKIVLDVLAVKCATAEALMFVDSSASTPPQAGSPSASAPAPAATAPVRPIATQATSAPILPRGAPTSSITRTTPAQTIAPATQPSVLSTSAAPAASLSEVSASRGPTSWEGFIETVRKTRPLLASILEHGNCVAIPSASNEQILQIAYQPKDSYFRDQLQSRVYHEQLLTLSKEYFGKATRVQLEIRESGESLADKKRRELEEKQKNAREAARNHPTIMEAKALFGGELVRSSSLSPCLRNRSGTMANRDPMSRLIFELSKLPGIGEKTATRLAYYILRQDESYSRSLAEALTEAKQKIVLCQRCYTFTDVSPCRTCSNTNRDHSLICVVERPSDVFSIEQTGTFRGVYHVLHGALSPLDGIGPDDLKLRELIQRLNQAEYPVRELILATNPSVEGEATSLYIARLVKPSGIRVTQLAHGIPVGGMIEYTDRQTIGKAIENRMEVG